MQMMVCRDGRCADRSEALRSSILGDVRIMFPMICTIMELRQAKMVLNDVMEELEDEGIEFRRDIPIGMMVEVPAAVIQADQFAKDEGTLRVSD